MPGPSVTIFGPLGFIGQHIVPTFVSALTSLQISSLQLATRDTSSSKFDIFRSQGATIVPASFDDKTALVKTLQGTDVVISCMGTKGDYQTNKHILIKACAEAGVQIYIPSEWGTDHRHLPYPNQMFASKSHHHAQARSLGLRTIAIYTGLIMETAFTKWLGFDTAARTWRAVGSGDDKMAMTSQRDLGPLTLRVVLVAWEEEGESETEVPEFVRVFSENRSVKEYREVFERVSGQGLRLELVDVKEAEREYERVRESIPAHLLGPLIPLLVARGSFGNGPSNAREVLNPGETYFKWKTIEEYAQEVNGLPWETGSPF